MPIIQGKTKVTGIIGNPVCHSLSPIMQNSAFAFGHLDYVYVPFTVIPENLERAVIGLTALGVCGFNVTIPHKTAIIPFLDHLDESAVSAGAVNTVQLCGSSLIGYNTDGAGLLASLSMELGFIPGEGQILVMGAGGAARGAIAALCRSGARRIIICNRSLENARSIMLDLKNRFPDTCIDVIDQNQVSKEILGSTSLLLNTTSLGMNGERIDYINPAHLPTYAKVYDMVYSTPVTPLVDESAAYGLAAVNGLGMLVAQGELAFEIWTGQKPPEGVMRRALNSISSISA